MCGRFRLSSDVYELVELFAFGQRLNLEPRYNIAPTQPIAAVRLGEDGERELTMLRWGLVPFWSKDAKGAGFATFNARAEGIEAKPAFREAYKRRRCLIPADGFYEWDKPPPGTPKQPYLIERADGRPFAFAGLWDRWKSPAGEVVQSATIITTQANEKMAALHDRMPVILDAADHASWLDPARPEAGGLLRPCPADWLTLRPVSRELNNWRNEGAELVAPLNPL